MSEVDELFLQKNLFFLGNYNSSIKESQNLLIQDNDLYNNQRKVFYQIRSYGLMNNFPKAQSILSNYQLNAKASKDEISKFVYICQNFLKYMKDGSYDKNFMEQEYGSLVDNDEYRKSKSSNLMVMTLSYILYKLKEFQCVLTLTESIPDIDLMGLRFCCYWEMNRFDMMEKTIQQMSELEEESSLSQICRCIIKLVKGDTEEILNDLNEFLQKYDQSLKVYNLIGIGMIQKGMHDKAMRIYQKALSDLEINSPQDLATKVGDKDLEAIFVNLIKLLKIANANPQKIADYEEMLKVVNSEHPHFSLVNKAEEMFNQALEQFKNTSSS